MRSYKTKGKIGKKKKIDITSISTTDSSQLIKALGSFIYLISLSNLLL